jgi:hypothetical protein
MVALTMAELQYGFIMGLRTTYIIFGSIPDGTLPETIGPRKAQRYCSQLQLNGIGIITRVATINRPQTGTTNGQNRVRHTRRWPNHCNPGNGI